MKEKEERPLGPSVHLHCYANPWLEQSRQRISLDVECNWRTLLSRIHNLLPDGGSATKTMGPMIRDLKRWGNNKIIYEKKDKTKTSTKRKTNGTQRWLKNFSSHRCPWEVWAATKQLCRLIDFLCWTPHHWALSQTWTNLRTQSFCRCSERHKGAKSQHRGPICKQTYWQVNTHGAEGRPTFPRIRGRDVSPRRVETDRKVLRYTCRNDSFGAQLSDGR